jgi:hypothetical protein
MPRMRTRAARPTVPAQLPLVGPEDDVRVGSSEGERREADSEARTRRSDRDAQQRLATLGVTPTVARQLVAEHGTNLSSTDSMRSPRWLTVRCAFERAGCCRRLVRVKSRRVVG